MEIRLRKNYIWGYFVVFFVFWCFREMWLVQYFDSMASIPNAITSAILKVLIWIVPVFFFIKWIEKETPLSYLGLLHHFKKGLKWMGAVSFLFISYFFILNFTMLHNTLDFRLGLDE